MLRRENESLREEDGAVGGNSGDCKKDSARLLKSQQLSRDLHLAASIIMGVSDRLHDGYGRPKESINEAAMKKELTPEAEANLR